MIATRLCLPSRCPSCRFGEETQDEMCFNFLVYYELPPNTTTATTTTTTTTTPTTAAPTTPSGLDVCVGTRRNTSEGVLQVRACGGERR